MRRFFQQQQRYIKYKRSNRRKNFTSGSSKYYAVAVLAGREESGHKQRVRIAGRTSDVSQETPLLN